jgi:hypothetical protein
MMMEIDYMMQAKGVIMNNFTPDYISLCKNDKVQGLRPFSLDYGEWYWAEYTKGRIEICCVDNRYGRQMPERTCEYWLPRSDQLDQCIADICKKNKWFYKITFYASMTTCEIFPCEQEYEIPIYSKDSYKNPLICKIKLLISLLKEE